MDNLKTLMDRKEYELVIKLTEKVNDANDLFYRISAYVALGQLDNALKVIETKKSILQQRLSLLIKIHMETLCLAEKFDQAFEELKYYENLPYESQEVEEILKEIPKMIRLEEKKSYQNHTFSDEQIIASLQSEDPDTILVALDMLREKPIANFLPYIKDILTDFHKQSIRTFALLLLVSKKINISVDFNSIGKICKINPSKTKPPFENENFNSLVNLISSKINNPSISENMVQILSTYILYIYPNDIEDDTNILIQALKSIAEEYLKMPSEEKLIDECKKNKLDFNKVSSLIDKINYALEDF